MQEKTIKFGDSSFANFKFENKQLTFFIQARVLGKDVKTTSTTVTLTEEETKELILWLEGLKDAA